MIKPYKKYLVSDTGEFKDSKTGKTIPWRIALDGMTKNLENECQKISPMAVREVGQLNSKTILNLNT